MADKFEKTANLPNVVNAHLNATSDGNDQGGGSAGSREALTLLIFVLTPMFRAMPDLDLEPRDYRPEPQKGQPIFQRGGIIRLAVFFAAVAFVILLNTIFSGPAHAISDWLWSFIGR